MRTCFYGILPTNGGAEIATRVPRRAAGDVGGPSAAAAAAEPDQLVAVLSPWTDARRTHFFFVEPSRNKKNLKKMIGRFVVTS